MKKATATAARMQTAPGALQPALQSAPRRESPADPDAITEPGILRALCLLDAPWAFRAGARLTGLDVLAVERYAAITGREVAWHICERSEIAGLLRSGEAELAVGGLPECLAADGGFARVLASSRRVASGQDGDAPGERHVWLLGALGTAERWRLKAYLLWQRLQGFGRR
jgi:hypothetical protein